MRNGSSKFRVFLTIFTSMLAVFSVTSTAAVSRQTVVTETISEIIKTWEKTGKSPNSTWDDISSAFSTVAPVPTGEALIIGAGLLATAIIFTRVITFLVNKKVASITLLKIAALTICGITSAFTILIFVSSRNNATVPSLRAPQTPEVILDWMLLFTVTSMLITLLYGVSQLIVPFKSSTSKGGYKS